MAGQTSRIADVQAALVAALPAAREVVPALIPFDARARKALERTFREALRLGHTYIGTVHVLLALLELDGGVPVILSNGVDKAACETAILSALRELTEAT